MGTSTSDLMVSWGGSPARGLVVVLEACSGDFDIVPDTESESCCRNVNAG